MHRKIQPLLCELHAHTRWSDGELTLPELVDLYGRSGFDVLCVTDHVLRSDPAGGPPRGIHAGNHGAYLTEIEAEAARPSASTTCYSCPGSS